MQMDTLLNNSLEDAAFEFPPENRNKKGHCDCDNNDAIVRDLHWQGGCCVWSSHKIGMTAKRDDVCVLLDILANPANAKGHEQFGTNC
mmetsp:Transcript_13418/g.18750  ORF Transcript_13418/g.18750 Transcript_13418/m.18750 type:complete len:88 (-) Transcript_13418:145-408(-)